MKRVLQLFLSLFKKNVTGYKFYPFHYYFEFPHFLNSPQVQHKYSCPNKNAKTLDLCYN